MSLGAPVGAPIGAETLSIPHMLELIGVSHSGPIAPNKSSCWSRLTGSIASGLILKDVSCEVSPNSSVIYNSIKDNKTT